jgi:DNA-binding transcriptional LysR family regulator
MDLGEVDLAIGYFPDLVSSVFKQQVLFRHRSACLVRKGHPTIGPEMTLDSYLGARHIAIAPEGRTQEVVELGLAAQGLTRRVAVQVGHFVTAPFLVAQSDLVVTLPRPIAVLFAQICDLVMVQPPSPFRLSRSSSFGTGDSMVMLGQGGCAGAWRTIARTDPRSERSCRARPRQSTLDLSPRTLIR